MPAKLEAILRREAARKFPNDPDGQDRYVYGTLAKHQEKAKGKA